MTAARPRPATKLLAGGLTLLVASTALGFLAGTAVRSPAQVLADTAPPGPTLLTEAVRIGTVARSVAFDGVVERAYVSAVPAPAVAAESSSAVVSRLPLREGDVVRNGTLVAEVSGRPVLVLAGRVPAFRTLAPGADGSDVQQLQAGLRSAGLRVTDSPGRYGAGTAAAVAALYERHGYEAVVTGTEQVEAASEAVRGAERGLEQARSGGDGSAVRYAAEDLARARADLAEAYATAGAQVPFGEIVFVPSLPATVATVDAALGAAAGDTLLHLAAGRLVVRGTPQSADLRGLRRGAAVELLLTPSGHTTGSVASVSAAAVADAGDGDAASEDGRTVTIVPARRLGGGRAGTPVRVIVTVAQSPTTSLVVPVSAVTSATDGTTYVTVVEGRQRHRVEVTTGFLGDGQVQVVPDGPDELVEGDRVAIGLGG